MHRIAAVDIMIALYLGWDIIFLRLLGGSIGLHLYHLQKNLALQDFFCCFATSTYTARGTDSTSSFQVAATTTHHDDLPNTVFQLATLSNTSNGN